MPDTLGYLRLSGLPAPQHVSSAAKRFRYNPRVFVAHPWPDIFAQDEERRQTLDEAERTYLALADVYTELGYELVPLPLAPVEARLRFVLAQAGPAQA
ncbi:AAA family ATPase [Mesorhizobium qingshengii]|uniref:AAA family ATPase n=1 Tax=Mesorhizobium qingshengii TaxID=1165689 RepID=UPI001FCDE9C4|nr:AAA family ATPase [Mesorhizobium qingshengii]